MRSLSKQVQHFATLCLAVVTIGTALAVPVSAAPVSWTGGAGATDITWGNGANWSSVPLPPDVTSDVTFTNTPQPPIVAPSNEVNASTTINSLWYSQQSDTPFVVHTTQIDSGQTLTISGSTTLSASNNGLNGPYSLLAGNVGTTNTMISQTVITGPGKLAVENAGGDIVVSETTATALSANTANAILNLSGLATFTANIDQLLVGYNTNNTSGTNYERANGTLYLAQSNTITMNNPGSTTSATNAGLVIGYEQRSANKTSTLYLGQTNTLYTTTAAIGARRQRGTLAFNPALIGSNPTLKMRGLGDTDLVPVPVSLIVIGDNVNVNSGNQSDAIGLMDLNGGSADILATSIILGRSPSGTATASRGAQGTLTFNAGTINTTGMIVGLQSGNWAVSTSLQGTVNVAGSGNLIVGSSGMTLAQNLGTTGTAPSGALNVNGGTVTLDANITDGGGSSTLSLAGGTLNMQGHNIGTSTNPIDTLTLASGTLKNVGQINGGGAISKTTAGILTIDGACTYTGATNVMAGKLLAEGSISSSVTVNDTATLGGKGSIGGLTVNAGGTLATGDSPGQLTVNGNVTLGGTMVAEIMGSVAGTGYDQLVVNGTVGLSGTLSVVKDIAFTPDPSTDKFWILLNDDTDALTGAFTNYADGAEVFNDGASWTIHYGADSVTGSLSGGNDVVIAAVPEPATFVMLIVAGGLCLMFRRYRNK